MRRILSLLTVGALGVTMLSGCAKSSSVSNIPALTLEEVAGKRLAQLSTDQKEGLIYKYVSDRIVVDRDKLMTISDTDMSRINTVLSNANQSLKGENKLALSEEYANYLLLEFAKTPYEWEQIKVDPVGFDPAARLYFVDVTYNTTKQYKKAIPNSKIAKGSENEELLKQKRYRDYIYYLELKGKGDAIRAEAAYNNFVNAWGPVADIMEEQQGVSLLERTRKQNQDSGGLGKLTYSGLVSDAKLSVGATMTVRYILRYKFNLGEETDLEIMSLYVKDYALDNADKIIDSYNIEETVGVEVLKPFIDQTILSYNKAIEECNEVGLNSLFEDYSLIDKYYEDMYKYSYISIGGYTYDILERNGTNVVVKVNREIKTRARGADMSLPSYDDVVIFNMVLSNDDSIKIKSVYPVKSTLVGEPLSVIRNVNGISELIQYSGEAFTESNKGKVEDVIKKFSKVVLEGEVDSTTFTNIVDIGVSQMNLQKIADTITSINANKKATYIVSWDTKTNVYCSLTLREIFQTSTGNLDTESVIELVNRNGVWRVVNYTRVLSVKTTKTDIDTKTALCVDEK